MSANRSAFTVARCADDSRRADILTLVHAAFAGLSQPSGALRETLDDVAARFAAGPVLIAQAGDELIGSVYGAVKEDGLLPDAHGGAAGLAKARRRSRVAGGGRG